MEESVLFFCIWSLIIIRGLQLVDLSGCSVNEVSFFRFDFYVN